MVGHGINKLRNNHNSGMVSHKFNDPIQQTCLDHQVNIIVLIKSRWQRLHIESMKHVVIRW